MMSMVLELEPRQSIDSEEPETENGKIPRSYRSLPIPIEMVRELWYGSSLPDHYMSQNFDDLPRVEPDDDKGGTAEPKLNGEATKG